MLELLQNNLMQIVGTILLGIVSFLGAKIKTKYDGYVNTKIKKEIVNSTVRYVEQVFNTLHGQEKLNKAKEKAIEWLNEKGIKASETELEILIESVVNEFNQSINK